MFTEHALQLGSKMGGGEIEEGREKKRGRRRVSFQNSSSSSRRLHQSHSWM